MPEEKGTVSARRLDGRTVEIDGLTWRYFSGTHYLGLQTNRDFLDLVSEGLSRWGAHFGGSRRSNLRLPVFEDAERLVAKTTGAEAALVVSGGTLAGQLLVHSLAATDHLYFAPNTHPAMLLPGVRPAGDWENWLNHLQREAANWKKPVTLVFNRMDPLLAKPAPVEWLQALPPGFHYRIVIDDSHYLGIMGREGGGSYSDLVLPDGYELIVISSLGKAMGMPAGCILGNPDRIAGLWDSPMFGGASPPPPGYLHAFVNGQSIYRQARLRLRENIRLWESAIPDRELFSAFPDYPVYYTPDNRLAPYLEGKEILISSFPYPGPADNAVTRIVVNAAHTEADLHFLADCLKQFQTE